MSKETQVQIDHFGMFSKNPGTEEVLFHLGFAAAGGSESLVPDAQGELPGCMHFVMDNGYMEYMRTYPEDFEKCQRTQAGVVYFEFAMKDAQKACEEARKAGFQCTDVIRASRYADHGEKKGEAIFECIALDEEIMPNIMIGGVSHKTRELFYNNRRYRHKNGAYRIEGIYLCGEHADIFEEWTEKLDRFQAGLGIFEKKECIRSLYFLDRDAMEQEFGLALPGELKNIAAVVLKTDAWDCVLKIADLSGYAYRVEEHRCIVNLLEKMNVMIVFEK